MSQTFENPREPPDPDDAIPKHPLPCHPSPLLRLPAELRNKIYAYASDHITITRHNSRPGIPSLWKTKQDSASLLLTCRQTHHEASPFLTSYRHMTWRHTTFFTPKTLPGGLNSSQILTIVIVEPASRFATLQKIVNLRRVEHLWPELRDLDVHFGPRPLEERDLKLMQWRGAGGRRFRTRLEDSNEGLVWKIRVRD